MTDWVNFAAPTRGARQFAAVACIMACVLAGAKITVAQQGMAYVKAGPAFNLDNTFFNSSDTGWSIAGGVRQPLAGRGPSGFVFIDLGGSFLTVAGDSDARAVPGTFVVNDAFAVVSSTPLADLLEADLVEINRASADAAIGWQRTPEGPGGGLGMMFRMGGRWGHIHGDFHEVTSATTNALIAGLAPGQTATLLEDYSNTDITAGLFTGAGFTFINSDICSAAFGPLGLAIGTEVEVAHDWIDFGNYQDSGFWTGTLLFSFELYR